MPGVDRATTSIAAALILGSLLGGSWLTFAAAALAVCAWVYLARDPGRADATEPSLGAEVGILAIAAVVLVAGATLRTVWDEPIGQDANRYLANAVALGSGDDDFHRWRGPLHAWATLGISGVVDGLIPASKLLSIGSMLVCMLSAWGLGRALLSKQAGLLGAALLAAQPDVWIFARNSTPYPLFSALVGVGTLLAALSLRRPAIAAAAGVVFGLAIVTDLRAQPIVWTLVAAALIAAPARPGDGPRSPWLRRAALAAGIGLGAALTSLVILRLLPFQLESLSSQVRGHSFLLAHGPPECRSMIGHVPGPLDLVGGCARGLLVANLRRLANGLPLGIPVFLIVAALGVRPGGDRPRRGALLLILPVLPVLPALLSTMVHHRYLLPLAPLLAPLFGAGLMTLGAMTRRSWVGPALGAGVAVAWLLWPGTLLGRGLHRDGASTPGPTIQLGDTLPLTLAARAVRPSPGDRVVDCATAAMAVRLYPIPVEDIGRPTGISSACRTLLEQGPTTPGQTWVVTREPPVRAWAGWTVVFAARDRGAVVLRGAR